MSHIFYDLIVVGHGTAAAVFINTLDIDKMFPWFRDRASTRVPRILIVGAADPWAGQRGDRTGTSAPVNKINQPMPMISQYRKTLPTFKAGGWDKAADSVDERASPSAGFAAGHRIERPGHPA
jgi:hypothetical protein